MERISMQLASGTQSSLRTQFQAPFRKPPFPDQVAQGVRKPISKSLGLSVFLCILSNRKQNKFESYNNLAYGVPKDTHSKNPLLRATCQQILCIILKLDIDSLR